jgi:hypothetical protein
MQSFIEDKASLEDMSLSLGTGTMRPREIFWQLGPACFNWAGGLITPTRNSGSILEQERWCACTLQHKVAGETNLDYYLLFMQKVIVTSHLFPGGDFSLERLRKLSEAVEKQKLVVDLSCRRRGNRWVVAMNKWQTLTNMGVSEGTALDKATDDLELAR